MFVEIVIPVAIFGIGLAIVVCTIIAEILVKMESE